MSNRGLRTLLLGLLAVLLVVLGPRSALLASAAQARVADAQTSVEVIAPSGMAVIPIFE